MVLVYRDTIHSFGGATETGDANVTMFIDVVAVPSRPTNGDASDQTGTDIEGGGGMDGDAKQSAPIMKPNNAHTTQPTRNIATCLVEVT